MATDKNRGEVGKVRVNRYGGFHAPAMARKAEVIDGDLSDAESEELQSLLNSMEPVGAEPNRRIPDAFVYEVEIERDGKVETLEIGETKLTDAQRALVRWVEAKSKK